MKRCPRCLQLFETLEVSEVSPLEELADMFLISTSNANPEDICPECKEKLGMMGLLGFGE